MTTFALLLVMAGLLSVLIGYARHDRFAGPATLAVSHDDLGSLHTRSRLVPRG